MALGHERLDVYDLAIGSVAWVYEKAGRLEGVHRAARDPMRGPRPHPEPRSALDFTPPVVVCFRLWGSLARTGGPADHA